MPLFVKSSSACNCHLHLPCQSILVLDFFGKSGFSFQDNKLSFKLDLGAGKLTQRIGRCFSFGSKFISFSPVLAFQFPEIKPTHSYSAVRLLGTYLHHDEGEGLDMVPSILSNHLCRFAAALE